MNNSTSLSRLGAALLFFHLKSKTIRALHIKGSSDWTEKHPHDSQPQPAASVPLRPASPVCLLPLRPRAQPRLFSAFSSDWVSLAITLS